MDKLDKQYLSTYIENLERAIEYLFLIDCDIRKGNMYYFKDGIPINIVGHLVYSIGGFTKERRGKSFYEYLEYSTGLMPSEIFQLNKMRTTLDAAEYLENLVESEYKSKLLNA